MSYTDGHLSKLSRSTEESVTGYAVTVAVGATDVNDEVTVFFDSDEEPREAIEVQWRRKVGIEDGEATWMYPENGDGGAVIFLDEAKPWLIW